MLGNLFVKFAQNARKSMLKGIVKEDILDVKNYIGTLTATENDLKKYKHWELKV